ncbi:MAG TPA: cytochrome P450 [Bryobacteraceae bacterium]|nr:cytochrome P450 [Bryobacteraceae bacterium]
MSRYADVAAALREPLLSTGSVPVLPLIVPLTDRRSQLETFTLPILACLKRDVPVDLVAEFANPWSRAAAMAVVQAPANGEIRLIQLARAIFCAAADPFDPDSRAAGQVATSELARLLPVHQVQAFVAMSQSLPCLLANSWLALLHHPEEMRRLQTQPQLMPNAVEELLRYAGPAAAQFRRARGDVEISGSRIAAGEVVLLNLAAANRDPAEFPEPDRLRLQRNPIRHLAFGAGAHACPGAGLIRMAAAVATDLFLRHFPAAQLIESVPHQRFAIRSLRSLKVLPGAPT